MNIKSQKKEQKKLEAKRYFHKLKQNRIGNKEILDLVNSGNEKYLRNLENLDKNKSGICVKDE